MMLPDEEENAVRQLCDLIGYKRVFQIAGKLHEEIDLQTCEHCSKDYDIETMRMMEGCWFCAECTADFQKHFDACDHKWSPHIDEMGDPGQCCEKCSGFVRDDDFPLLFGAPTA